MAFAGIVLGQTGNVIACRTSKQSIFKTSLAKNQWIIFGITTQICILAMLIYLPFMQPFFGTTALGITDWLYLVSITLGVILIEEIRKFFSRRFSKTAEDLNMHDHT